MTPQIVRIGTRGSDLARWQTDHVAALLQQAHAGLKIEITVISTKGDRVLDTPLPLIGVKGVFTAELEAALHAGEIDFAVHSLKDLPTDDPPGLVVGAILERANPADVLVSRDRYTLETLPEGAVVGSSSHRRAAQLLHLRPDLKLANLRGNIDTRVRKAFDPDGAYDAIVLAHAGLARLEMEQVISQTLSYEQMLPAPGQGALAVQCRDEPQSIDLLSAIAHADTMLSVTAERTFLAGLGGGCSVPVAALASKQPSGGFLLRGRVCAVDGSTVIEVETAFSAGTAADARQAGAELAQQAIGQGADRILESVR